MERMVETTERVFHVPAENLAKLEKKISKLARRSERLGCGPIKLEIIGHAQQRRRREGKPARIIDIAIVQVTGPAPKIPGWTFGGTLEHLALDDGTRMNILRTIIEGVPEEFRTAKPWCVHCDVDRRWRDTFLVRHDESGEWKQVGRNCIADFLGHPAAADMAEAAEWLRELEGCDSFEDEDEGGGGFGSRTPDAWELQAFLAHCYEAMAIDGWVSKKAADIDAGRRATADSALCALNPPKGERYVAPEAKALERAFEAIEWASDLDAVVNDFLWNIRAIAKMGVVSRRTSGLAAAIACAYEREQGRIAEHNAQKAISKHFGTIGKRERFTLTVSRLHSYETQYGTRTAVTLRDDEGNVALWRASGVPDLRAGFRYTVKATVKQHGEYEGVAQTEMQRLTVEEEHGNPAAVSL